MVNDAANGSEHDARLWTPWRMAYIAGGVRESGCVFCNRVQANDDRRSLILHRAAHSFVLLNLFPYSTGHLMIVPNDHVSGPEDAAPETLREMADVLPVCLTAARRTLGCAGFNAGMNIGAVAGAGVTDHLHEHVVPRWIGDANFMPILASTTVMPELLPVTYAKLRAEFERRRSDSVRLVVIDASARRVLIERREGTDYLPAAFLEEGKPVWRSAVDALAAIGAPAGVIDWAGAESTLSTEPSALLLRTEVQAAPPGMRWVEIASLGALKLEEDGREAARRLHDPALVRVPA